MIDWDKPIETSDGYPARLLSTDVRSCGELFAAVQVEYHNCSEIKYYKLDGLCTPEIRNRKTKRVGWVNVYPALCKKETRILAKIYESEQEAKGIACKDVIATVKIEWEE